jgi:hypothetical protein
MSDSEQENADIMIAKGKTLVYSRRFWNVVFKLFDPNRDVGPLNFDETYNLCRFLV